MTAGQPKRKASKKRQMKLLADAEEAHRRKIDLVRRRLESGYYLTDAVARATAREMVRQWPRLWKSAP
jgi:hypothetical protein